MWYLFRRAASRKTEYRKGGTSSAMLQEGWRWTVRLTDMATAIGVQKCEGDLEGHQSPHYPHENNLEQEAKAADNEQVARHRFRTNRSPMDQVTHTITASKRERVRLGRKRAPSTIHSIGSYFRPGKHVGGASKQGHNEGISDMDGSEHL